jgi:spermidine synthase
MHWLFLICGSASITGQILYLREILAIFHGTEIAIAVFFASWLTGIGVGASVGARASERLGESSWAAFLHALAAMSVVIPSLVAAVRYIPELLGVAPAELAPLHGVVTAVIITTGIPATLTGFLFPLGCKAYMGADDRAIAGFYVFEALGSLAAGLLFTFVLVRSLSPLHIAALIGIVIAAAALVFALKSRSKGAVLTTGAALVWSLLLVLPGGDLLARHSVHSRWGALHPGIELLTSRPTPYQLLEVGKLGPQYSLFGNSNVLASFPDPHAAKQLAALVMAQNPHAKRILLIGGGIGSLAPALLQHPVEHIDIVEPDPAVSETALEFLPPLEAGALRSDRCRIIHTDARAYVKHRQGAAYDIVISMVPDPVSAYLNRYYTVEFFREVRAILSEKGLFLTGVTSAENFWGAVTASYAGSVFYSLREVFPEVLATPGDTTLFLASPIAGLLSLDPATLVRRYQSVDKLSIADDSSARTAYRFDPRGFYSLLPPERTAFVRAQLAKSPALINTDFRPVSSSQALILWGKFSGTAAAELPESVRRAGPIAFLIPLAALLLGKLTFRLVRGPCGGEAAQSRALWSLIAVGTSSMGLQIVLMFAYQSLFGHVFERIGLFAAFFMTGLAGGGVLGRRLLGGRPAGEPAIGAMLAIMAGLCLVVPTVLRILADTSAQIIEIGVFALVFGSGMLTGLVFPLAVSRHLLISGHVGESSGYADAADHYGAAVGALVTGTLLVPLLGMQWACVMLALLPVVPLGLFVAEPVLRRTDARLDKVRSRSKPSFPYVRVTAVLITCTLAALGWYFTVGPPRRPPTVTFNAETLTAVSGSRSFSYKESPFPHYTGGPSGSSSSTVTFSTIPVAGDISGYGGPINLLVSLTPDGTVLGLKLVESQETPSYIQGLEEWLTRFEGVNVVQGDARDTDTITGATVTCNAVKKILTKTGREIAIPILGTAAPPVEHAGEAPWKTEVVDHRLWVVVGLFALFVVAYHSRNRVMRLLTLAGSLVVLGFWLNAPFTLHDLSGLFQGRLPASGTWWRVAPFIGALAAALLWGQAFCGYLCPFGALQECGSLLHIRSRTSFRIERAARYVKFVVLAVVAVLFLVTDDTIWLSFSPLRHFFSWEMSTSVLVLSITVLAASVFYFRFWCRYLCPAGAFLALFNKVAVLRRFSPTPRPGLCDLGVTSVNDVDCIKCHRCLHTLPRNRCQIDHNEE